MTFSSHETLESFIALTLKIQDALNLLSMSMLYTGDEAKANARTRYEERVTDSIYRFCDEHGIEPDTIDYENPHETALKLFHEKYQIKEIES